MTTLSNRAMLVTLNISQWTARRLDKRETDEVNIKHNADPRAARVNKSLLPGSASLDAIHKKSGEIRTWFYSNTLPWGMDGVSIIKAEGYLAFTAELRRRMDEWWHLVDKFVAEYPQLVLEAQLKLNGMYRAEDYPHPTDILEKFGIDARFMPVPDAGDWRVDLADDAMRELRDNVRKEVERSQGVAMREAWTRLMDVVKHAHERLAKPDNIFRDSLIDNARQVCAVLPTLNITNDPDLERMRQEVELHLCTYEPAELRKNEAARSHVADKMRDVMSRMGAMYAEAA